MEQIILVGANHRLAPVAWRERVALTCETLPPALDALRAQLDQAVILSTCNRTEIYAATDDLTHGEQVLRDLIEARLPLYVKNQRDAVVHLFHVAAGLDSMVLGEFEILGQVRAAYQAAEKRQAVGPVLSALFHAAIHTGKRARAETAIGRGAASVPYAAVRLARETVGTLRERCVLVIGAGEMGARVAKNLRADGVRAIIVANRTYAHAVQLARDLGGRAIHFDDLGQALIQADVVISATGAPHLVLDTATVARAMAVRPERPLCVVDIAMPRDVEAAAANIPNVHLFDLDGLQSVVRENIADREKEVERVRVIIAEETEAFWQWYAERRAAPVIAGLRERAEAIRSAELDKALRRLPHLSERDRDAVAALSEGIVGKLLAAPTARLKAHAQSGDGQVYVDVLRELFELGNRF